MNQAELDRLRRQCVSRQRVYLNTIAECEQLQQAYRDAEAIDPTSFATRQALFAVGDALRRAVDAHDAILVAMDVASDYAERLAVEGSHDAIGQGELFGPQP